MIKNSSSEPHNSGGRRPMWSAREPNRSWLTARQTKNTGKVNRTAPALARRSTAIAGRQRWQVDIERKGGQEGDGAQQHQQFRHPGRFGVTAGVGGGGANG